jgi:hypothetical protein
MPCKTTCLLAVVIICTLNQSIADSQPMMQRSGGRANNAKYQIDPNALELLDQLAVKYRTLESFSCEVVDDFVDKDGRIEPFRRDRVEFRRPFNIRISPTVHSAWSIALSNRDHAYITFSGSPGLYTELPHQAAMVSLFDITTGLPPQLGLVWIGSLLAGYGENPIDLRAEATSISSKPEGYIGYQPLELVTMRRIAPTPRDWNEYTFTIGSHDHLLYQQTARSTADGAVRTMRYNSPKANPALPDIVFEPPVGTILLPSSRITSVSEETVKLDKGSLDGLLVGDDIWVYGDDRLVFCNASLEITETKARSSTALVTSSTGLHPGELCIVIKRRSKVL